MYEIRNVHFVALTRLRLSRAYLAGLNLEFGERRKAHERHEYTFVADRVKVRSCLQQNGY